MNKLQEVVAGKLVFIPIPSTYPAATQGTPFYEISMVHSFHSSENTTSSSSKAHIVWPKLKTKTMAFVVTRKYDDLLSRINLEISGKAPLTMVRDIKDN